MLKEVVLAQGTMNKTFTHLKDAKLSIKNTDKKKADAAGTFTCTLIFYYNNNMPIFRICYRSCKQDTLFEYSEFGLIQNFPVKACWIC